MSITVEQLSTARDAYLKARRAVVRCNEAQTRLRDLHLKRAAEHSEAKATYERIRDAFCDQAIEGVTP